MRFREHRGGLAESMETLVVLKDKKALAAHLGIPEEKLSIKLYQDLPDDRIGWQRTFIVKDEHGPIGYCDEEGKSEVEKP